MNPWNLLGWLLVIIATGFIAKQVLYYYAVAQMMLAQ